MLLAVITDELHVNHDRIGRAGERHTGVAEQLAGFAARGKLPGREVYLGGLFNPALLSSTAWQTARETERYGVSLVKLEAYRP